MGKATKIQWCDHTFNPWRGCTKVSAGCANCYAERLSHRNPAVLGVWGDDGTRVVATDRAWADVDRWHRAAVRACVRRRVFCASMADVFEDRADLDAPRGRLFDLIDRTPMLDWLLLTKRPENIMRLMPRPRANVWLGTSVEDQAAAEARIPHLLRCPATVRFLSCEPLLGPIEIFRAGCPVQTPRGEVLPPGAIGWVIVGGESGQDARPCDLEWIRSIRDQCKAAGVPCFVKQIGARPVWNHIVPGCSVREAMEPWLIRDPQGGDPSEWPEDLRVREFPKMISFAVVEADVGYDVLAGDGR